MADTIYESWQPEVGQRVAYLISSECDFGCPECGMDGHNQAEFGSRGTRVVTEVAKGRVLSHARNPLSWDFASCNDREPQQGHFYAVHPDQVPQEGSGFWAAAVELTPLAEPAEAQ